MSTIVLLEQAGAAQLQQTMESWDHKTVPTSQRQMLADWPPRAADVLLIDTLEEHLNLIERLRQIEIGCEKPPFPKLGIGWTKPDSWRSYQSGIDACLGQEPQLLKALLSCPQIWAGHAFDPQFALNTMGHISVVDQMIEVFLAETPKQFKQLQDAYRGGDSLLLAKAAHRFGGGLAIWGQIPALRATMAIERAAEKGHPTEELFLVLSQALTRLRETLDHLCDIRSLGMGLPA